MKTIVMNTLTGAVSEYDNYGFQSITPTRAGSAVGLYDLTSTDGLDIDQTIVANVLTGKTLFGGSLKKFLDMAYLSIKGEGVGTFTAKGEVASYDYPVLVRPAGQSRAKPGRGIRENYLAFGYSNADGSDFQLDRMEIVVGQAQTRRV